MLKTKKTKASVLVFALIILFIGIAAAIGIASSTMISQKNSINTASSTQSFQVADSGAEIVLNKIKNASDGDTLGSLGLSCSSGVISGNIGTGKEYKVTAFKIDESNPITDCSASLSDIDRIKSVGSYKNTNRAVEVAVAAESSGGATGGCVAINGSTLNHKWGSGCKANGTSVSDCSDASETGYECGYISISTHNICLCVKE